MSARLSLVAASASLALLAGCAVGPDYRGQAPPTAAAWATPVAADRAVPTIAAETWWTAFHDPLLDRLVAQALAANHDLRLATARLREARADYGGEVAGLLPQGEVGGDVTRAHPSPVQPGGGVARTTWHAGFDAGWELDLFGGARRAVEAAGADVERAALAVQDVRVSLAAEVVAAYLDLRAAEERIAALDSVLTAQTRLRELVARRAASGLADSADLAQADADLAQTRSRAPAYAVARSVAANRLGVLIGGVPPALAAMDGHLLSTPDLLAGGALPDPTATLAPGLPSELLLRRPDLRAAERAVAAATARIGVARADWFPRFSLTGSFGWTSNSSGGLFSAANRDWSVGPAVRWPILAAGRIAAQARAADARLEQAGIAYEQAVVRAAAEVEDALVRTARGRERVSAAAAALHARQQAAALVGRRHARGLVDVAAVLEQERLLGDARSQLVDARAEQGLALAALAKAIGGGWTP